MLEDCKTSADYRPVAFEWYKYVGLLAIQFSMAVPESAAFRSIPSVHFGLLVGSLNRCCRLMLANLRLANEGRHGEATRILDRCIFETCVKTVWLCEGTDSERFERFLADGLKRDMDFKQLILREIEERASGQWVIERRMLASIDRSMILAEFDEQRVSDTKKLPDMATMLKSIGYGRLTHVATERMGSHAVHGSWTDLLTNYLEIENARFVPRDNEISMDLNQFVAIMLFVLKALEAFIRYVCVDSDSANALCQELIVARDEILDLFGSAAGRDFEPVVDI